MKKWIKITLIAAAVLAALIVIAAIAVSPVAKNYIEKHDRELIGRSIRMERLRMNIFTGRLRIEGLRIGGSEDSTTFFRLDSFEMRMRLWPLLGNRVLVKKISFAGPDVKIYQRGNAFSFDDITARFAGDTTAVAATPEKPSKPWEIGIYDISIRNGRVFYKDLALDAEWGMNDINLHIPGVYFSGEKTDVGAVLNFAEGGSLSTDVGYNIESSEFDIGIRLQDFALAGTLPYFRQSLDVTAVDGRLSADIRLRGNTEHLLSLTTEGTASLAGFALRDRQQRPVAGVDTLGVKLAEGDLGKMRFVFDRIYVSGLSALFEMTPEGNNLAALMKSPAAEITASDAAGSATPSPTLRIADLEITNGRVTVRDLTMHRPFEYTVSEIRMRSRDFDPSKRNSMTVDARMQKTGSAKLRWEGTLEDMDNQNITLWLTNLDLRDFGPYCEHYTAYPLTKGNLTFRSQNVIRDRYLDGTNHLDMFEPKVDKKRREIKAEMNIPLKLGLYVLKDKKGHVKMDLPVRGSLDSPEFSYRKIVLKAIGNVLLKVVTAPFSFLSGNKENIEYINIDPLQYVFTSEQYASLDKIAQALQDKPEMHIVLTQRVNMRRALPRQAAGALRMAYAEHLKSADTTGRQPMSMLEYEKIQQTDIRTPAIMAFADSLLAQRGISPQGLSADDKALALYREKAAGQLARMMAARNKALAEYMQSTHGATAPAFRVQTMDSLALPNYAGRDRYTIALEVDGETVEVEAEDDNAGAGADAGAGTDAGAEAETDAGTNTESDTETNAETHAGTDTE
ncbi:DUF748 domain-containing protein [Alistipes finegoldii]|uniref:DUF748 domain-containing protein n=1 Tax=Alistipes finegoldii TaxID=214856 RepID=UPI0026DDB0AE|nr:DUF748 domain-containing protein [Alistipes finegoldii]